MQGLLSDLPLLGVLELIHSSRQTGVLEVESEVPYTIAFQHGEIISGGILDWLGSEAIQACPMLPQRGKFSFEPKSLTGTALGPYEHFTTEWARISDEWEEICVYIGSPSRIFSGGLPLFDELGGRSIRAAARKADKPVIEVAQTVAEAIRAKQVIPLNRFAWFGLLLQPDPRHQADHPLTRMLNGQLNLGEIVSSGHAVDEVRDYLLDALQRGLRFPGSGWVLRDLVWEKRFA